jgi:hypothetical protein
MAAMTGAVVLLVVGSGLELHRRRVVVLSLAQVVGVTGISPPEHGVLVGGHHADRLAQVGADDRRSVPPGVPRLAAPRPYALGIGVPSMLASLGLALSAAASCNASLRPSSAWEVPSSSSSACCSSPRL